MILISSLNFLRIRQRFLHADAKILSNPIGLQPVIIEQPWISQAKALDVLHLSLAEGFHSPAVPQGKSNQTTEKLRELKLALFQPVRGASENTKTPNPATESL